MFAILICVLVPELTQAQFSRQFEAGAYQLAAAPGESQPGELSLRNYNKLLIKTPQGRTRRLNPSQVSRFRIGTRQYVAFTTLYPHHPHPERQEDEAAFVEQLASGEVTLVRYDRTGNTGLNWLFLFHYHEQCYFLTNRQKYSDNQRYDRGARPKVIVSNYPDSTVTLLRAHYPPAELASFQRAVKPFFATRPDLLSLLAAGQLTLAQLPAALYALNNDLPYSVPAPRPTATSK